MQSVTFIIKQVYTIIGKSELKYEMFKNLQPTQSGELTNQTPHIPAEIPATAELTPF